MNDKNNIVFNSEKTLGVDEKMLSTLEAEVGDYRDELDSLCDSTEEQKLEVTFIYYN